MCINSDNMCTGTTALSDGNLFLKHGTMNKCSFTYLEERVDQDGPRLQPIPKVNVDEASPSSCPSTPRGGFETTEGTSDA